MKAGLVAELCRVFHANRPAMLCALSHGQVTVDGHVMRVEFDTRWPAERLRGRYAEMNGRMAQIFGSRVFVD